MTAGLFDRTYELWRRSLTPDGGGGFTEAWAKAADVSGRAYPTRLMDEVVGLRLQGNVTWTFAAASDADVREGDEIRFDGRVLAVRAVSVTGSGRRLEAACEEERP
jgi:head-tail adaptor